MLARRRPDLAALALLALAVGLFFWDVLFGTAHITRKYPAKIGLQDDILFGPERWTTQMFYPLVHSKREHSALRPGGHGFTEADLQTEAKQEAA